MGYSLVWWDRDVDSWDYEVEVKNDRVLILLDGIYKTFNTETNLWEDVSTTDPTEEEFDIYGMNPEDITRENLELLGSNIIEIVIWDNYTEGTNRNLEYESFKDSYSLSSLDRVSRNYTINGVLEGELGEGKVIRYSISDIKDLRGLRLT